MDILKVDSKYYLDGVVRNYPEYIVISTLRNEPCYTKERKTFKFYTTRMYEISDYL